MWTVGEAVSHKQSEQPTQTRPSPVFDSSRPSQPPEGHAVTLTWTSLELREKKGSSRGADVTNRARHAPQTRVFRRSMRAPGRREGIYCRCSATKSMPAKENHPSKLAQMPPCKRALVRAMCEHSWRPWRSTASDGLTSTPGCSAADKWARRRSGDRGAPGMSGSA
jgi:hypothetical protein